MRLRTASTVTLPVTVELRLAAARRGLAARLSVHSGGTRVEDHDGGQREGGANRLGGDEAGH
jgi:hypothetical protein